MRDIGGMERRIYAEQADRYANQFSDGEDLDHNTLKNLNKEVLDQVARDALGYYTEQQLKRISDKVELPRHMLNDYYRAIRKNGGRSLSPSSIEVKTIADYITYTLGLDKPKTAFNKIKKAGTKNKSTGH